jgi:hypothetical protein
MIRTLLLSCLFAIPCFGQTRTGNATASGPCSPAISGNNNSVTLPNCSPIHEPPLTIVVPQLTIATREGLPLSDFPDLIVSAEMTQTLRRHSLLVVNLNEVELQNFVVRFQLPEPVIESLIIESRPAGVEISWNACRMSLFLVGEGASAKPLPGGGAQITTAPRAGASAGISGGGEVCSPDMNNKNMAPTGIYQLQIERIPASATIQLGFLTSNDPKNFYLEITKNESDLTSLRYFGDGTYQLVSDGRQVTRPIFVELSFDPNIRAITSLPSSGERGKRKIRLMHTS